MRQGIVLFFLLSVCLINTVQADSHTMSLSDGSDISIQSFGEGADRILWLPSEFGFRGERELALAHQLADKGIEIWLADLHSSYFLPPGRNSLSEIPIADIAELIDQSRPENGRLYILSTGRGAALSLMAAHELQLTKPNSPPLGGLILFHPNLHAKPPQPGQTAEYLPVTYASNQPIYLIQPGNSAKRWYLGALVEKLEQGGSDVFTHVIPRVSDGFHLRPDFTDYEATVSARLPDLLYQATRLLNSSNNKVRATVKSSETDTEWSGNAFKETLQPYPGEPLAPSVSLQDLSGNHYDLTQYQGKVVLLNFWATWCPPCIKEIPSLGRLQERLAGDEFVVLSVDIGEPAEAVADFLKRVPARFPVLLDTDGKTVQDWNIRAFPTTFLIDKTGHIRYAYFGALEWDEDEVVAIIRKLL